MKKIKTILSLTALCLSMLALVSCGGEDGTANSDSTPTTTAATAADTSASPDPAADQKAYTFTVVFGDTNQPVSDVQVQICKGADFCLMPVASDADGKVNYVLSGENDYGEYEVHIIAGIPEGYSFDNNSVKTNADTHSYTLTLVKTDGTGA